MYKDTIKVKTEVIKLIDFKCTLTLLMTLVLDVK